MEVAGVMLTIVGGVVEELLSGVSVVSGVFVVIELNGREEEKKIVSRVEINLALIPYQTIGRIRVL